MTLGDLEFKAEDFRTESLQLPPSYLSVVTETANRLLRERLEKAPITENVAESEGNYYTACCGDYTHKARLVCIEEIKK